MSGKKNSSQHTVFMYPGGRGGMALYSYKLANALSDEGLKVTLFVDDRYELDELPCRFRKIKALSSRNDSTTYSGTRIERVANILIAHLYNWFTLFRYVRADRPAILHVQPQFYLLDWFALSIFAHMRARLVLTVHDVLPHKFYCRHFKAVELAMLKYMYKLADVLIVHSMANAGEMMKIFGIGRAKIATVPHGEYSLPETFEGVSDQGARGLLNLADRDRVILFFGHIRRDKGIDILLAAFDRAADEIPDIILVIAGSVIQGESFEEHRGMIDLMRNGHRVKCFIEYIEHSEIPIFFAAAEMVVLPYTSFHSQSGVGHLAQAFGKPVIATHVGGLPELVEDGKTGLIVPPGDVERLCEAMIFLLDNGEVRRSMGKRAKRRGIEVFSWSGIAKETVKEAYGL